MATVKRFRLQHVQRDGTKTTERPRLMISVDGRRKSLVVAETTVIASVDRKTPDAELWALARSTIASIAKQERRTHRAFRRARPTSVEAGSRVSKPSSSC